MERLKVLRGIDQDNDHAGAVFFHQVIQFILDSISKTCRMLDDQIFPCEHVSNCADPALI